MYSYYVYGAKSSSQVLKMLIQSWIPARRSSQIAIMIHGIGCTIMNAEKEKKNIYLTTLYRRKLPVTLNHGKFIW